ncbi:MAG: HNH endonuclease signature motif containing protein [Polyangiales bacterium]
MFDSSATEIETTIDNSAGRELSEWQLVDRRLRTYAAKRAALDAAESFDLVRAADMRMHVMFGFSTFLEYMERRLGYVPHTARERLRVARALGRLPMVGAELARGELTYSHVRELSRVATADTEEVWLAAVIDKTAGEVQELVAGRAYGDLPTDPTSPDLRPRTIQLELPPEAYALWREARRAVAKEYDREVSDADVVTALARNFLSPGTGAERPAHQLAFTQCRDCKRATMNGAGRAIEVAPAVVERAACDARVIGDLDAAHPHRATSSVTPRMREQVFARDRHHCRVPGCRSSRNLDIHHIIPKSHGGPHELWNLLLLCSLCRARHKSHYAAYPIMPRTAVPSTRMVAVYAA